MTPKEDILGVSEHAPWYKDPTNPLVVNHEQGDFAATAMVYGAELTDLRAEVASLRRQHQVAVAEAEKWKRIAQDRCTCVVTCGDRPEGEGGICKDLPRSERQ